MQLARVIGDVVVTRKDENLMGVTLLVLQPIAADGSAVGRTLVAVDSMGAGVGGNRVLRPRQGSELFRFIRTEVRPMPASWASFHTGT